MQIFKGVASGKQSFREHCATKWLLEANPRNISASKISRYTVYLVTLRNFTTVELQLLSCISTNLVVINNVTQLHNGRPGSQGYEVTALSIPSTYPISIIYSILMLCRHAQVVSHWYYK